MGLHDCSAMQPLWGCTTGCIPACSCKSPRVVWELHAQEVRGHQKALERGVVWLLAPYKLTVILV